jgi:hypothetical protein
MPNFIIHFNKSCETFGGDDRMTCFHLAIYMSLFYHWNKKKFMSNMPISRDDVMQIACVGSYNTYYRCLKDLHTWGYITYVPSNHPNIPSRVTIHDITRPGGSIIIDITPDITAVPDVIPSINSLNVVNTINETKGKALAPIKKIDSSGTTRHSRPIDLKEAADYFREQKSTVREAEKFFNYYQGNGWQLGGRTAIKDWHATARSWILKAEEFKVKEFKTGAKANHLATDNDKDFAEPL